MQITQREVRGVIILDLEGRLVLEDGVTPFVELMNALGHRDGTRILLNFAKVTYLDSAGVGAVAWKYVTVRKRNGDVKLLNLHPKSHTVLKTTKLLTILEIVRVRGGGDRQLRRSGTTTRTSTRSSRA